MKPDYAFVIFSANGTPVGIALTAEQAWQNMCQYVSARKNREYYQSKGCYGKRIRITTPAPVSRQDIGVIERLREKVEELMKHGKQACEYTDGWEDALLKIKDALPTPVS